MCVCVCVCVCVFVCVCVCVHCLTRANMCVLLSAAAADAPRKGRKRARR